jgi:3-O-methylgallate 3,4-dioxygenase
LICIKAAVVAFRDSQLSLLIKVGRNMAELTNAFGSSHGVMVTSDLYDWLNNFAEFDKTMNLVDLNGNKCRYEDLLQQTPNSASNLISPLAIASRFEKMKAALERLRQDIAGSALGALIVVGDDQNELFDSSNMPAFAIYCGDTIHNSQRSSDYAESWVDRAKDRRLEPQEGVHYPVHADLARHIVRHLRQHNFDPAVLHRLPEAKGESHAMSFVHRYLLRGVEMPIVPLFINTFFPPNQPSPSRCVQLGKAVASAVSCFPENINVGILASGGLSHFVLDETLDRGIVDAIVADDLDTLIKIPEEKLQSGTSEVRNWICVAGAAASLPLSWVQYIPGYRTPALTGTGLCFARWERSRTDVA